MAEETDWLSQRLMAELFQSIYEKGELQPEATVKKYLTLQIERRSAIYAVKRP